MPKFEKVTVSAEFLAVASGADAQAAQVARDNLARTLEVLDGRDPAKTFGKGVELDKIKFTDWRPDTCACHVRFLWHSAEPEDDRQHHAHASIVVCPDHKHLATDHVAHHDELLAENRHKNLSRQTLAEELGVDVGEIAHSYGEKRTLRLHHPSLKEARAVPRKG